MSPSLCAWSKIWSQDSAACSRQASLLESISEVQRPEIRRPLLEREECLAR